jgi:hypothetical protein
MWSVGGGCCTSPNPVEDRLVGGGAPSHDPRAARRCSRRRVGVATRWSMLGRFLAGFRRADSPPCLAERVVGGVWSTDDPRKLDGSSTAALGHNRLDAVNLRIPQSGVGRRRSRRCVGRHLRRRHQPSATTCCGSAASGQSRLSGHGVELSRPTFLLRDLYSLVAAGERGDVALCREVTRLSYRWITTFLIGR